MLAQIFVHKKKVSSIHKVWNSILNQFGVARDEIWSKIKFDIFKH